MKNAVRIIAVLLLVCMLGMTFVGCGKKLSGTYSAEIDAFVIKYTADYKFSGSKVTVTKTVSALVGDAKTTTIEGTYEIIENEDDTMSIKFEFETEDDQIKSGTVKFEEGEDYIKMAGIKYTLKK